jgi:hypothetical protein
MKKQMKNLKIAIIPALIALSVASTSFASDIPPQPDRCPGVSDVQNGTFLTAQATNGVYVAMQFSNYGTNTFWGFGVANIQAVSSADAITKATNALTTLQLTDGPVYSKHLNAWGCSYSIGSGYVATALTTASPVLPTDLFLNQ